jgi:hypothetical protein
MNIGVAGLCLMNIIWTQAAPTAVSVAYVCCGMH